MRGTGTGELSWDQIQHQMRQIRHSIDLLEIEFCELATAYAGTGEHLLIKPPLDFLAWARGPTLARLAARGPLSRSAVRERGDPARRLGG